MVFPEVATLNVILNGDLTYDQVHIRKSHKNRKQTFKVTTPSYIFLLLQNTLDNFLTTLKKSITIVSNHLNFWKRFPINYNVPRSRLLRSDSRRIRIRRRQQDRNNNSFSILVNEAKKRKSSAEIFDVRDCGTRRHTINEPCIYSFAPTHNLRSSRHHFGCCSFERCSSSHVKCR